PVALADRLRLERPELAEPDRPGAGRRGPDEEEPLAVGEEARPGRTDLAVRAVDARRGLEHTPAGGHDQERVGPAAVEQDLALRAPRDVRPRGGVADDNGGSAVERDPLQLAVRDEHDLL